MWSLVWVDKGLGIPGSGGTELRDLVSLADNARICNFAYHVCISRSSLLLHHHPHSRSHTPIIIIIISLVVVQHLLISVEVAKLQVGPRSLAASPQIRSIGGISSCPMASKLCASLQTFTNTPRKRARTGRTIDFQAQ